MNTLSFDHKLGIGYIQFTLINGVCKVYEYSLESVEQTKSNEEILGIILNEDFPYEKLIILDGANIWE
jgi:hypothetical protein